MDHQTASQLGEETSAWCARAEEALHCAAGDCLAVVRDGIFLRRRWDLVDRQSPARRRVLGLLAAAQTICHCRLAEMPADGPAGSSRLPAPQRAEYVAGRLAEDDRYLADLLDDHSLPAETLAFAVECFRDDLHWLGTLVALVEGGRGIDFAGRVLLEQESLQRRVQAWKDDAGPPGSSPPVDDELARAAETLRTAALTRRAESLLHQPQPRDAPGWRQRWQAASRLAARPPGLMPPGLQQAVENQRAAAVQRWTECLGELPPEQRHDLLHETADDLADAASELLTFLEDLPLDEAVRSLEILAEDVATCLKVVQKCDQDDSDALRRRLARCNKTVGGELLQRRLDWRMERLFGHRAVAALERLILALLLLFVVMLAVEGPLIAYERAHWPGSNVAEAACAWLDLGICVVFLAEFSLKWWLAEPRRSYFYRNWITGLLPAIPVGFLFYVIRPDETRVAEAGELFVLLRALRYLRLPQMARWLRIARPVLRAGRLIAFVMQASDRMVRHVAPLLNRNLVLFERAAVKIEQPPYRTAMAALGERFQYRASEAIAELPRDARQRLVRARIEDLTAMLSGPRVDAVAPLADAATNLNREIPLEDVIARLLAATPADISQRIGRTLSQSVARWCRAFDVFGIRRLPLVRDMVAAGRRSSPYGTDGPGGQPHGGRDAAMAGSGLLAGRSVRHADRPATGRLDRRLDGQGDRPARAAVAARRRGIPDDRLGGQLCCRFPAWTS